MLAEHAMSPVLNHLLESGGLFTSNGAHKQLNAINTADTPIPGLIYILYIAQIPYLRLHPLLCWAFLDPFSSLRLSVSLLPLCRSGLSKQVIFSFPLPPEANL